MHLTSPSICFVLFALQEQLEFPVDFVYLSCACINLNRVSQFQICVNGAQSPQHLPHDRFSTLALVIAIVVLMLSKKAFVSVLLAIKTNKSSVILLIFWIRHFSDINNVYFVFSWKRNLLKLFTNWLTNGPGICKYRNAIEQPLIDIFTKAHHNISRICTEKPKTKKRKSEQPKWSIIVNGKILR